MNDLNFMPKVKFVKTHPNATLPKRNHKSDSGFDLFAVEEVTIPARGSAVVPVGIKVADIPEGYWFKIEARSGLGFKYGLTPHPGIIDNQYRGDCGVKLYNFTDENYTIKAGERPAQIVFYMLLDLDVEWADAATQTTRGENGFGSSGK